MVFFLLFKINVLSVRRVPGNNAQHVFTSTDLRSVQRVALFTSVIAVHEHSIHPKAEATTMYRMFSSPQKWLILVNWTCCLSFASRLATMCALFIGKISGSSLTAWLTESVSWIVSVVIVQVADTTVEPLYNEHQLRCP